MFPFRVTYGTIVPIPEKCEAVEQWVTEKRMLLDMVR